jgi:hypothetical protein
MNATLENPNAVDVDALNTLLRGEISAVETYNQTIEKFRGETIAYDLHRLRDEHASSVAVLRDLVDLNEGEADESSGAWGVFASAITGTAKVIGPATVLAALKQGEQHGIAEYESAMDNDDLPSDVRETIRNVLMPKCKKHVEELDRLIGGLDAGR